MENTCINCGNEISGKFCSNCGQKAGVKRITFREGWEDFWARIYGFDGMFPRTLKDLTTRPGEAARIFISGNRARYYGPVGYFFLMITLFLLVLSMLNMDVTYFMKYAGNLGQEPPKAGSGQEKAFQQIFQFITDNLKLVSFIYIPFQAFASRYIFFRKQNLNFLEHMVLPFYLQGHLYWVSIVTSIILKLSNSLLISYPLFVVSFLYIPYGYMNLFQNQSKLKAFAKGLGVYLIGQFFLMVVAILIVILALIINPEFAEMIKPSNNI